MAIDTRQKRMSAIHVGSPWRGPMVAPTGSDTQAKRQAAAFMYSGILSDEPAEEKDGVFVAAWGAVIGGSAAWGAVPGFSNAQDGG